MSADALGGNNLYPNGPQFGLSNSSGGFGMIGSGPLSGVGLSQRSVSNLVRDELERPYAYIRRLSEILTGDSGRSAQLFSSILGGQFRGEIPRDWQRLEAGTAGQLMMPTPLPSVDTILRDSPASPDSILQTKL